MTVSEKIKTINNKIEQNKAQYDLDRFLLYHQEMSENMNFWLEKMFYHKDLLKKAATMKRFEYSPLGKELLVQTDIAKKQSRIK